MRTYIRFCLVLFQTRIYYVISLLIIQKVRLMNIHTHLRIIMNLITNIFIVILICFIRFFSLLKACILMIFRKLLIILTIMEILCSYHIMDVLAQILFHSLLIFLKYLCLNRLQSSYDGLYEYALQE